VWYVRSYSIGVALEPTNRRFFPGERVTNPGINIVKPSLPQVLGVCFCLGRDEDLSKTEGSMESLIPQERPGVIRRQFRSEVLIKGSEACKKKP
jgi:hypothetical protein